jgi:hypothetical protein
VQSEERRECPSSQALTTGNAGCPHFGSEARAAEIFRKLASLDVWPEGSAWLVRRKDFDPPPARQLDYDAARARPDQVIECSVAAQCDAVSSDAIR